MSLTLERPARAESPAEQRANARDERTARDAEVIDFAKAAHYHARRIHSATVLGDRLLIEQEAGALIYRASRFLRQRDGGDAA